VARLEESLGVLLLQRTSRKVALTEDGRQLLLGAGPLVDELQQALESVANRRSEPRGLVRVTAPVYTGATRVAKSLAAFVREHPAITIELDASNTLRDLIEERYDLAIRVGPVADSELVARRLWEISSGLFATRDVIERELGASRRASRPALSKVPAVTTRRNGKWRFKRRDGEIEEIVPNARFTVNEPRAAIEVARHGAGFVIAPIDAAAQAPELVPVRTVLGEPETAQVYVVYPSRRLLPARVRLVIDWLAR
jgi:DNA-binding transcriptional LysR family regulator